MSRVVIENHLDGGVGRIGSVELLEEAHELPRPVAIFDAGVHRSSAQIDSGEHAQRAVALVYMVTREARAVLPIA